MWRAEQLLLAPQITSSSHYANNEAISGGCRQDQQRHSCLFFSLSSLEVGSLLLEEISG